MHGLTDVGELNPMKTAEELVKDGWEKQTVQDEPRLSEVVETYEEIGFEVYLAPFRPEDEPGCAECMKESPEKYKTVYTRRKTE